MIGAKRRSVRTDIDVPPGRGGLHARAAAADLRTAKRLSCRGTRVLGNACATATAHDQWHDTTLAQAITDHLKEDQHASNLRAARAVAFSPRLAPASPPCRRRRFAFAADPLKIGLILPLTGPFASTGKQIEAACRLYIARNGDTVAGRKVELIVKDDTGVARNDQAHRAGADRAGPRERPGRLRAHAAGAGGRAGRHRSEGADDRDGGGDVDHSDALAVHRALGLHAAAGHRADGRLGGEEQDQARRHAGDRLRSGHRRREDLRQALHRGRRHRGRIDAHAAAQSGLRAVPAARQGRQARRAVRVRAFRARAPR